MRWWEHLPGGDGSAWNARGDLSLRAAGGAARAKGVHVFRYIGLALPRPHAQEGSPDSGGGLHHTCVLALSGEDAEPRKLSRKECRMDTMMVELSSCSYDAKRLLAAL